MDARGVMFWMEQVFRALRGEAVTAATSRLTLDEIMVEIAAARGIPFPPQAEAEEAAAEAKWTPYLGPLPGRPYRTIRRNRVIDGYHLGHRRQGSAGSRRLHAGHHRAGEHPG